jgi:hypothetical protein
MQAYFGLPSDDYILSLRRKHPFVPLYFEQSLKGIFLRQMRQIPQMERDILGIADESKLETVTFSAKSSSRSLERVRG